MYIRVSPASFLVVRQSCVNDHSLLNGFRPSVTSISAVSHPIGHRRFSPLLVVQAASFNTPRCCAVQHVTRLLKVQQHLSTSMVELIRKQSITQNKTFFFIFSTIITISYTMADNMGSFFSPTTTGSLLPHLLLLFIQIFALALPPFPNRSTIFVPLICMLVILTWRNLCSDSIELRSLMIGQSPWYLGTLTKLLYYYPERDFWRADREKHEALRMKGLSAEKWKWAAALYCSPRLIRWNQQVKGIPSSPVMARNLNGFFIERLKSSAILFVIIDFNQL